MSAHATILAGPLPGVSTLMASVQGNCELFLLPEGLRGYAVMDPGHAFDRSAQDAIYAALVPVTTSSFGADMTPYWAERKEQGYFFSLSEFIMVADQDDNFVGWSGYAQLRHDDDTILYIDSSGMVPHHQARGIMRAVWSARLTNNAFKRFQSSGRLYFAARSESPVIFKMLSALAGGNRLYPNPMVPTPEHALACGRALAEWLGQAHLLEADSLVLRGAYASLDALYGELPSTGSKTLDNFFRRQLGPLDAFLLVGEVTSA